MLQEPRYPQEIAQTLWFKEFQVTVILELIKEGATVPFIARYRKERTGNLDENHIRDVIELQTKIENLYKAKQTAINGITEMGAMTDELMANILKAKTLKEVEEIYKPYKSKKKTKAMIAIEKWFQVVADLIKNNRSFTIPPELLETYPQEEILEGCTHIISAEISANADLRASLIDIVTTHDIVISKLKGKAALEKLNEKDKAQIPKFEIYADFTQRLSYLKPYQILALNRGENLWILSIKIEKSEKTLDDIEAQYANILNVRTPFIQALQDGFDDGYEVLFKSVENEVRGNLSEVAEDDAIETFRTNLGQLLMTKPEYGKTILAIDPGFRAGCKMVLLDAGGNPLLFDKIFLDSKPEAITKLKTLLSKAKIDVIVIGNGTGVNETVELIQPLTEKEIYIVNESGASVYSASKVAQEEFPDLDSLDRGTVSIGRRYIDPLSELVKVPVGSIGVGMYQHDIPEKKLEEKLGYVVEDVVNEVGINVNTASYFVLEHISGIGKTAAKKIYNHRPYKSREQLKKQLSEAVYQQAAWFLRVPESKEPLDVTDIHPEQYALAKYIQGASLDIGVQKFYEREKETLKKLYPDVTVDTLEFILSSLARAGQEKRINSAHKKATVKGSVQHKVGDVVEGVIRNVVAFGAFVDIGMKNDGLVHVSQIADRFISDPKEEVEVGQTVQVRIMGIDEKTGKIQLSMRGV